MARALRILGVTAATSLILATSASAAVSIRKIYYNPPGTDTTAKLNEEFISLKNTGARSKAITGWRIRDASGHAYKFGTYKLCGGCTVKVHTGHGTNTRRDRYWGSGSYIWNNTGDTATLRNAAGSKIDSCHYAGGDTYKLC